MSVEFEGIITEYIDLPNGDRVQIGMNRSNNRKQFICPHCNHTMRYIHEKDELRLICLNRDCGNRDCGNEVRISIGLLSKTIRDFDLNEFIQNEQH